MRSVVGAIHVATRPSDQDEAQQQILDALAALSRSTETWPEGHVLVVVGDACGSRWSIQTAADAARLALKLGSSSAGRHVLRRLPSPLRWILSGYGHVVLVHRGAPLKIASEA